MKSLTEPTRLKLINKKDDLPQVIMLATSYAITSLLLRRDFPRRWLSAMRSGETGPA